MKTIISLFNEVREEQKRSRALDDFMTEALIDPTLIDRILADREGPEEEDEAPFFKPRERSIDGILHYAV